MTMILNRFFVTNTKNYRQILWNNICFKSNKIIMDLFLVIIGFFFVILGIFGSFLPVLPGPIMGWVGLLLLHLTSVIQKDWTFLGITLAVAIIVFVLDYIIPVLGTKKYGGTKYGVYGSMIGLILGLGFGPLGIILGPFLGALVGELIKDSKDTNKAMRAAYGSFIGFLLSTGLKFAVSLTFMVLFIKQAWAGFYPS
jgi:uncharacterized protein YqgC (DUF456 family)